MTPTIAPTPRAGAGRRVPRTAGAAPARRGAEAGVDEAAAGVVAAATSAPDWEALSLVVSGCTACPELVAARTTVVVGACPGRPRVAFVGEAPGANEDATGLPFVGKAGQLLDLLLAEVGIDRAEVAVLNTVKCRPPANRTPRPVELGRCRGWLERQLQLADPELVVALGSTATGWFHGRGARIAALRGRWVEVGGRRVLATYHPSAALRFGPAGAPMAALREDLALVAHLLQ